MEQSSKIEGIMAFIPFILCAFISTILFTVKPTYMVANFFVFLTFSLPLFWMSRNDMSKSFLKAAGIFFVVSNIMTLIIEYLYVKTDIWGFSKAYQPNLVGIEVLGAPIEEYVFWAMAPLATISAFVYYVNYLPNRNKSAIPEGIKLGADYVEDVQRDSSNRPLYNRGGSNIIYTLLIAFIAVLGAVLVFAVKGKLPWKGMLLATASFWALTMPFEQYAVINELWIYNIQKSLGYHLLGVPIEGWAMYNLAPLVGMTMFSYIINTIEVKNATRTNTH